MPGIFDSKLFNAEVFQGYVDRIPNTKRSELVKSRALRPRPDLASAMTDQTGGNYITTTLRGLISGSTPSNYDGQTDIAADKTKTFRHSRVVVGRSNAWTENDFSYDITGGEDFLENVAQQIAEYWGEVDQDTILSILKGVFNMSDTEGAKFVAEHTHDVSVVVNSEGKTGYMDATTMNTGMQKACGDNKSSFSMAIMHSFVATNLENLKLLTYLKYTDSNGMEREIGIGTINGRMVLVDDDMPTQAVTATAGVHTVTIGGTLAAGDVIRAAGKSVTLDATSAASPTAAATALVTALGTLAEYAVTRSGAVITFTEKSGYYGTGAPEASIVSTTGTIAVATTTSGNVEYTKYTTYVLGDGAIEYTDCGAKVPYEVDRNPAKNGGQDTLYSRQRKCFAPYGISFTQASMATLSPTDAELENGANWELVNSTETTGKVYISRKAIPIARIISRG